MLDLVRLENIFLSKGLIFTFLEKYIEYVYYEGLKGTTKTGR